MSVSNPSRCAFFADSLVLVANSFSVEVIFVLETTMLGAMQIDSRGLAGVGNGLVSV